MSGFALRSSQSAARQLEGGGRHGARTWLKAYSDNLQGLSWSQRRYNRQLTSHPLTTGEFCSAEHEATVVNEILVGRMSQLLGQVLLGRAEIVMCIEHLVSRCVLWIPMMRGRDDSSAKHELIELESEAHGEHTGGRVSQAEAPHILQAQVY